MSGHFLGADRLADRRRRWLATSSHDSVPVAPIAASDLDPLSTGGDLIPQQRRDSGGALPKESVHPQLPLGWLIPRSSWAYGIVGGMATLLVAALTWVVWPGAGGESSLTPLWIRLLVPPSAELVTGLGTVALGLAGQMALLIGWGRSRSLVDYAGQYRTWTRAGAACWLFAVVSRLGLDAEWRDWALTQNWPRFWNDTELLVLLPTLLAGAALGSGLRSEVARCQPSRTLLMLATSLYLSVVALKLGSGASLSTAQRALLIQNGMLAAHGTLLMCFWIHARHVLHETCDPAGESRRSNWLAGPHWRIGWCQPTSSTSPRVEEPCVEDEREGNGRDNGGRGLEAEAPDERAGLVPEGGPPATRGDSSQRRRLAGTTGQPKPKSRPRSAEPSPLLKEAVAEAPQNDLAVALGRTEETPGAPAPVLRGSVVSDVCSASESADSESADSEPREDQPSLKGLSKRERRRLQQEERLKERAGGG